VEKLDYLVIGHVSQDIRPEGYALGGTATYAAVTAQRLGLRAGIVTAAAPDLAAALSTSLPDIAIHCRPSPASTRFENIYVADGRHQFLRSRAKPLGADDIPADWCSARIVHLGPIAQEIAADVIRLFPGALVGLTPQGWLRSWNGDGRVGFTAWDAAEEILSQVDVLVFSPEDVHSDEALIRRYTQAAPLAVLTLERRGAIVYQRDAGRAFAARPVQVVDPTGAGDVFAAAFLVRYAETRDAAEAARFANVTASFSIEGVGISTIPTRAQVEAWLAENSPGAENPDQS